MLIILETNNEKKVEQISLFILNIFLNSFLAFCTVVFFIECIIFLFKIPQGRTASVIRWIPILKLPLDVFLYDFSKWSYTQGINPLNCEEGTRILSVTLMSQIKDYLFLPIHSGIHLTVQEGWTFTFADLIGQFLNPILLKVFAVVFVCITAGFIIRRLAHYYHASNALDSLAKNSQPLNRKMCNTFLFVSMKKYGVKILTSPSLTGSPFVAGLISSMIYIPDRFSISLSRKEYEAVLSHEMQHVQYKDSLVRLILDMISSVFWWIPTKWLRRLIEEGQEIGCDLKCKNYGIDSLTLASALYKSAKYSTHNTNDVFATHLTKHTILKRINLLTQPAKCRFRKIHYAFVCLAIGIAFFAIFLGRFWIF